MCSYNKDGKRYEGINFVDSSHVSTYWKPAIVLTQNTLAFTVNHHIHFQTNRKTFEWIADEVRLSNNFLTFPGTWFYCLGRVMLRMFLKLLTEVCQDVWHTKRHLLKEHFCINYLRHTMTEGALCQDIEPLCGHM
jgi:hypothetical protein